MLYHGQEEATARARQGVVRLRAALDAIANYPNVSIPFNRLRDTLLVHDNAAAEDCVREYGQLFARCREVLSAVNLIVGYGSARNLEAMLMSTSAGTRFSNVVGMLRFMGRASSAVIAEQYDFARQTVNDALGMFNFLDAELTESTLEFAVDYCGDNNFFMAQAAPNVDIDRLEDAVHMVPPQAPGENAIAYTQRVLDAANVTAGGIPREDYAMDESTE